jgi:hypothetical protein
VQEQGKDEQDAIRGTNADFERIKFDSLASGINDRHFSAPDFLVHTIKQNWKRNLHFNKSESS